MVYGNHGEAPSHIEDLHVYLLQLIRHAGFEPVLTSGIIPGEWNIIQELFDADFLGELESAKSVPGTRIIAMATEFLTGQTFNTFERVIRPSIYQRSKRMLRRQPARVWRRLPQPVKALLFWAVPALYSKAKSIQKAKAGKTQLTVYEMARYWKERFTFFERGLPHYDFIMNVVPHQLDDYVRRYGKEKVLFMPFVPWTDEPEVHHRGDEHKDIDVLFTGSVTKYRREILAGLAKSGLRVEIGSIKWASYMRHQYVGRAKLCIHVRQDANWLYPSVTRYHLGLAHGSITVGERAAKTCRPQEDFVILSEPERLLETCLAELAKGQFRERGAAMLRAYYRETAAVRAQLKDFFKPLEDL